MLRTAAAISAMLFATSPLAVANPVAATGKLDKPARQKLLKSAGAQDHLRVFAVDETCFPQNALEKFNSPAGASFEGSEAVTTLTLEQAHADKFAAFQTWAAKFAKSGDRVVYGINEMGDTVYGFTALCVQSKPVLEAAELHHANDAGHFVVTLDKAALAKLRKLSKVVRIAFVYDDDVAIFATRLGDDLPSDTASVELMKL